MKLEAKQRLTSADSKEEQRKLNAYTYKDLKKLISSTKLRQGQVAKIDFLPDENADVVRAQIILLTTGDVLEGAYHDYFVKGVRSTLAKFLANNAKNDCEIISVKGRTIIIAYLD
jgi:hypothetical protein